MLNKDQYEQLLKPLNRSRVATRSQAGRNLSYLEAWDVKAHLIRIFGFGGWSSEVLDASLAFEDQNEKGQWNVGYKVTLRLTVFGTSEVYDVRGRRDRDCIYTETAVGSATLPQRGEAHDMAVKTAESDALKRAAINLGTQFGLSLYDNGSTNDVVRTTLDGSWHPVTSLDTTTEDAAEGEPVPPVADSEDAAMWIEAMKAAVESKDVPALLEIRKEMNEADAGNLVYQGVTLAKWMDRAIVGAGAK